MTDEESGLENAIKHMEAALDCLVDPKDQVVAMRLSHALDLARSGCSKAPEEAGSLLSPDYDKASFAGSSSQGLKIAALL